MPSSKALTNVKTGAGKLHPNVASAASDFDTASGSSGLITSIIAAINQEVATPTAITMSLTAGATTVTLDGSVYGPVWLGASGEVANDIFDVVSTSDDLRVSAASGVSIYVSSVTGGSVGSASFTTSTLTLNLTAAIPSTGNYRILFSKRTTLNAFSPGAIATARRFVPNPANYENLFKYITGENTWNNAPVTTIYNLALGGLNERYNRSSFPVGGTPVLDGDGDGGLISRGGQALTLQATGFQKDYSLPPPDPYWAHYLTTAGSPARSSNYLTSYDGGSGYVGVLQQKLTVSSSELMGTQNMTVASRMDLIQREVTASAIGTGVVKTKINTFADTLSALNPDAGSSDDDRRTIRLSSGDFFWESSTGENLSEVAIGHDMIEVTLATGEVQVYVITQLFGGPHPSNPGPAGSPGSEDQRRALVRDLTGGLPNFPSGVVTSGPKFRLIKTRHFEGVGAQAFQAKRLAQADPVRLGYQFTAVTPPITSDPGLTGSDEPDAGAAEFYAPGRTIGHDFLRYQPMALVWGGHDARSHGMVGSGFLRGDGAVQYTQGRRTVKDVSVSTTSSVTWHPSLEGSVLNIFLTHASGGITVTVALDSDYTTNVMGDGDELTVVLHNSDSAPEPGGAGGTATATIAWPTEFKFSGTDGNPNPYNGVGGDVTVHKYHGILVNMGGSSKFLMTLTPYLGAGI